jgi:murein DD-endopeptidase MepM/ murein hydrolase activator NlpD
MVDHGGGWVTLYAHQSSIGVSEGATVSAGQTLGYAGSTGHSTGPHLHFEVRIGGEPYDPQLYLP